TVGPIPPELASIMGSNASGVAIQTCDQSNFCSENGVVQGDVVIRVNSADITDVASFDKATADLPPTVLLWIRRPALRMTTGRLLKIKYANEGKETAEGSESQESVDVQVLDVALPFADALETSRQKHTAFEPTPADLQNLGQKWAELPLANPLRYLSGDNRLV